MPNPQQWSAGNITNAGCFDDQSSGPASGKATVPFDVSLSYKTVFSSAPGNHRRHPGATCECEPPNLDWLIEERPRGFSGGRPVSLRDRMFDWVPEFPHGARSL